METRTDTITHLPHEVLYKLFQYLPPASARRTSESCRFFNHFAQDQLLWADYYQQRWHEPVSFFDDTKHQYTAESLHTAADQAIRHQAMHQYRNLYRFLTPHRHKPWAFYHLGMLYYYGKGLRKNQKKGLDYLIQGVRHDDNRCAMLLVMMLADLEAPLAIGNNAFCNQLIDSGIAPTLVNKLSMQNHPFFKQANCRFLLAWFYRFGIGTEKNRQKAKELYNQAIKEGFLKAPAAYVSLLHEENTTHLLIPNRHFAEKVLELLEELKAFASNAPQTALKGELYYQIAWQHRILNQHQLCAHYLKKASKLNHQSALIERAEQNFNLHPNLPGGRDHAINLLLNMASNGSRQAIKKLFDWVELPLDETIDFLKNVHPKAILYISSDIARNYLLDTTEELIHHPVKIIWLQVAAENGCTHSLERLLRHVQAIKEKHPSGINAYFCCAVGILYHFGIYGSDQLEADHNKTVRFLHIAAQKHPGAISEYCQTGIDEGLISSEAVDLLRSYDPRATVTCQLK